jgi:hypothetical protein
MDRDPAEQHCHRMSGAGVDDKGRPNGPYVMWAHSFGSDYSALKEVMVMQLYRLGMWFRVAIVESLAVCFILSLVQPLASNTHEQGKQTAKSWFEARVAISQVVVVSWFSSCHGAR